MKVLEKREMEARAAGSDYDAWPEVSAELKAELSDVQKE